MTEEHQAPAGDEQPADDGKQNALIHEGSAAAAPNDTNEKADGKVEILQPSGEAAPQAEEESPR